MDRNTRAGVEVISYLESENRRVMRERDEWKARAEKAEAEQEGRFAAERKLRLFYQGRAYDACNMIDQILGLHATKGSATTMGTPDNPDDSDFAANISRIHECIKSLKADIQAAKRERDEASARVVVKTRSYVRAKRERDEARAKLEEAVKSQCFLARRAEKAEAERDAVLRNTGVCEVFESEAIKRAAKADARITELKREKDDALRQRNDWWHQCGAKDALLRKAEARIAELEKLLRSIADTPDECVLCGADTRQQYDCRSCNIDHTGKTCFRRGEHNPECELKPFETVTRTGVFGEGREVSELQEKLDAAEKG
jgi:hypothetical protein